jgi:hypothetical protein
VVGFNVDIGTRNQNVFYSFSIQQDGGNMIEINYRVMELNNGGRDFTFKMEEQEFLRRIDITGI